MRKRRRAAKRPYHSSQKLLLKEETLSDSIFDNAKDAYMSIQITPPRAIHQDSVLSSSRHAEGQGGTIPSSAVVNPDFMTPPRRAHILENEARFLRAPKKATANERFATQTQESHPGEAQTEPEFSSNATQTQGAVPNPMMEALVGDDMPPEDRYKPKLSFKKAVARRKKGLRKLIKKHKQYDHVTSFDSLPKEQPIPARSSNSKKQKKTIMQKITLNMRGQSASPPEEQNRTQGAVKTPPRETTSWPIVEDFSKGEVTPDLEKAIVQTDSLPIVSPEQTPPHQKAWFERVVEVPRQACSKPNMDPSEAFPKSEKAQMQVPLSRSPQDQMSGLMKVVEIPIDLSEEASIKAESVESVSATSFAMPPEHTVGPRDLRDQAHEATGTATSSVRLGASGSTVLTHHVEATESPFDLNWLLEDESNVSVVSDSFVEANKKRPFGFLSRVSKRSGSSSKEKNKPNSPIQKDSLPRSLEPKSEKANIGESEALELNGNNRERDLNCDQDLAMTRALDVESNTDNQSSSSTRNSELPTYSDSCRKGDLGVSEQNETNVEVSTSSLETDDALGKKKSGVLLSNMLDLENKRLSLRRRVMKAARGRKSALKKNALFESCASGGFEPIEPPVSASARTVKAHKAPRSSENKNNGSLPTKESPETLDDEDGACLRELEPPVASPVASEYVFVGKAGEGEDCETVLYTTDSEDDSSVFSNASQALAQLLSSVTTTTSDEASASLLPDSHNNSSKTICLETRKDPPSGKKMSSSAFRQIEPPPIREKSLTGPHGGLNFKSILLSKSIEDSHPEIEVAFNGAAAEHKDTELERERTAHPQDATECKSELVISQPMESKQNRSNASAGSNKKRSSLRSRRSLMSKRRDRDSQASRSGTIATNSFPLAFVTKDVPIGSPAVAKLSHKLPTAEALPSKGPTHVAPISNESNKAPSASGIAESLSLSPDLKGSASTSTRSNSSRRERFLQAKRNISQRAQAVHSLDEVDKLTERKTVGNAKQAEWAKVNDGTLETDSNAMSKENPESCFRSTASLVSSECAWAGFVTHRFPTPCRADAKTSVTADESDEKWTRVGHSAACQKGEHVSGSTHGSSCTHSLDYSSDETTHEHDDEKTGLETCLDSIEDVLLSHLFQTEHHPTDLMPVEPRRLLFEE